MTYYRTCPHCGENLDPVEICDCQKEAALGAANAQDGQVEIGLPTVISTSYDTKESRRTQE